MEQWLEIRQRVLREGVSKWQILRETGMHWTTLEKILEHQSPPGYRRSKRPERPKIDPYVDRIRDILAQDQLRLSIWSRTALERLDLISNRLSERTLMGPG